MSTSEGSFTLRSSANADDAFAFLADFRHHPQWRDDVLAVTLHSGEDDPGVSYYRQTVRQGPGTAQRELRVDADPGTDGGTRTIRFVTLGDAPVIASGRTTITPHPDGSEVTVSIALEFHGAGVALRPVVAGILRRRMVSYRESLAKALQTVAAGD